MAANRYEVVLVVEGYDNRRDDQILAALTPSQRRLHTGAGFGGGCRDLGFNCAKLATATKLKKSLLLAARKAKARRPDVKIYVVEPY